MRHISMTIPHRGPVLHRSTPCRHPRATKGTPYWLASLTMAATCSAVLGKTTALGRLCRAYGRRTHTRAGRQGLTALAKGDDGRQFLEKLLLHIHSPPGEHGKSIAEKSTLPGGHIIGENLQRVNSRDNCLRTGILLQYAHAFLLSFCRRVVGSVMQALRVSRRHGYVSSAGWPLTMSCRRSACSVGSHLRHHQRALRARRIAAGRVLRAAPIYPGTRRGTLSRPTPRYYSCHEVSGRVWAGASPGSVVTGPVCLALGQCRARRVGANSAASQQIAPAGVRSSLGAGQL